MTSAVQIIAEHRMVRSLRFNGYVCEGDCGWEIRDVMVVHTEIIRRARDAHAAHVVAALTNAGKTIVESERLELDALAAELHRIEDASSGLVHTKRFHLSFVAPAIRTFLTAAARVAEGGERGE
ncbi:hypothetical protein GS466_24925 [Rhodococcus hoagii]|nr:hypothetical protein [Prescottella equi]